MLAIGCHGHAARLATRIVNGLSQCGRRQHLALEPTLSNMQAGQTPVFVMSTWCRVVMNAERVC